MSGQKRQAPISEKAEESREDNDYASEQDTQIEVSETTNASTSQENAIEPVVMEDTTITPTADFHLMTQEEEDLTI